MEKKPDKKEPSGQGDTIESKIQQFAPENASIRDWVELFKVFYKKCGESSTLENVRQFDPDHKSTQIREVIAVLSFASHVVNDKSGEVLKGFEVMLQACSEKDRKAISTAIAIAKMWIQEGGAVDLSALQEAERAKLNRLMNNSSLY
jgi:hypothetical protein